MNDTYVILTGSKDNAGDFLIKDRAKRIFEELRPDRTVIDFNAWERFDDEKLRIINDSKALILMGGPALQKNMYPGIYALPEDLTLIKVPIVTMGIGWKSIQGRWENTYDYPLSNKTMELLQRINLDGLSSSVRDFQTCNSLIFRGFNNYLMTGCPAYYDLESINTKFSMPQKIQKVAFSLGVSFVHSSSMDKLMKSQIISFKSRFSEADFEVVFHHPLDIDLSLKNDPQHNYHNEQHNNFLSWLKIKGINYVDISGSAENLIDYYSDADLHIGYRVHAHIFMNSRKKLSLLLSEDGRAKGTKTVIGGMVVNGYEGFKNNFVSKVMSKLIKGYDRYQANLYSTEEAISMIDYEIKTCGYRSKLVRKAIDQNYLIMKSFIKQLP